MANYHLSIKIFSRGKGASAVEKAAYRSGEKLVSDYNGEQYDYTRKGGVIHTEILLPGHAPREYADRATLWNAVERIENNDNAQLAREIEFSLPVELTIEQNIILAREFVQKTFVEKGMCADVCVHDKGNGNPHAHVMLTLRPIELDGQWGAKSKKEYILDGNGERIKLPSGEYKSRKIYTVDWNDQTKAEDWRAAWEITQNAALKQYGFAAQVDHRSYERQGVDKIPSIHLGPAVCQMESKGIRTGRGDINREAALTNSQIGQLRARIRKAKDWLYAAPILDAPTMVNIMENIAVGKQTQNKWSSLRNLKARASVLLFLQENHISNMEQLVGKITKINDDFKEVSEKIHKTDRRLGTLVLHLAHYENYKKHKAVCEEYRKLSGKKADAFYDKHAEKIQSYEAAKAYLDGVMNGNTTVPIKTWQAEQTKLTAAKYSLTERYYGLQDEVRSVELLRKGTEALMREDGRERQPTRGMEI